MKVIKSFDTNRLGMLSHAIDEAMTRIDYPWRFDRMTFGLSKSGFSKIDNSSAEVFIDTHVICDDEKLVKAYVYSLLISLVCKLEGRHTGNDIIDEIITNREMIRKGFGEELFYYYYLLLHRNEKIDTYHKYVTKSVPWLSFLGFDAHHSDFLREAIDRMKYRKAYQQRAKKLFDVLGQDMSEENIAAAKKICKRIRV
ncbi:MAG: hypothetical protein HZB67_02430 [Candidatus Aenigmarchaeota archaeon]|nr:hypothetical protein [Candidatus Aenigmarchaeota archaeon]